MTCLCMPAAASSRASTSARPTPRPPAIGAHVHAVLDAVAIAGPGAKLAEGAESDDARMDRRATSTGKPPAAFASNQASRFAKRHLHVREHGGASCG